jgi:hypothetical protein
MNIQILITEIYHKFKHDRPLLDKILEAVQEYMDFGICDFEDFKDVTGFDLLGVKMESKSSSEILRNQIGDFFMEMANSLEKKRGTNDL